jgi:hypothetical protein
LQLALEEDDRLAAGYRLLQRFRRLITRDRQIAVLSINGRARRGMPG